MLDIILGKQELDGGKVVSGETVVFGYYTQNGMNLKDNKKVIETIKDIAEVIPLTKGKTLTAAQLLERFLFPKHMHYNQVEKLSGGEKRRLYLLTILILNPNFLILDEPTNDLDIITLNVLEDFLQDFQGCLIIVSHDRYFMDKLVDHLFIFEGDGKIKDYLGKYNDYRLLQKEQELKEKTGKKLIEPVSKNSSIDKPIIEKVKIEKPKMKLSFKEKFEFEQLEKELPQLEKRKEELTNLLNVSLSNHEELMKVTSELGAITLLIEEKTDRWITLSEYTN